MTTSSWQQRWESTLMPTYGTPPLVIDRGDGVRVWDVEGREYLDFVAGIAVSSLGHAHPAVVAAVCAQAAKLVHTSNLLAHQPGIELAERLVDIIGAPARVFFTNSGTEAMECALKLARRYGHTHGGRVEVVATHNGFHGRTMGALSITGNPAKRDPFAPLPGPVRFVPFGDVAALREAVGPATAAVVIEPLQGEGGMVAAPSGWLAAAREICDAAGAMLIVDEIQSGIGRMGHWFASLAEGVRPDVITVAKGLGGGMPIGACIGLDDAGTIFGPGDHGSTFGGNPVSCAAALAVIDTIRDQHLLDHVKRVGERLAAGLADLPRPVVGVRGAGLWRGLLLTADDAPAIETAARRNGLLINAVKPSVLRLAPPLVVSEADVDLAVHRLRAALVEVAG